MPGAYQGRDLESCREACVSRCQRATTTRARSMDVDARSLCDVEQRTTAVEETDLNLDPEPT